MPNSIPPKGISELIDQIEAIREELLTIQHSLEKMEPNKPVHPAEEAGL